MPKRRRPNVGILSGAYCITHSYPLEFSLQKAAKDFFLNFNFKWTQSLLWIVIHSFCFSQIKFQVKPTPQIDSLDQCFSTYGTCPMLKTGIDFLRNPRTSQDHKKNSCFQWWTDMNDGAQDIWFHKRKKRKKFAFLSKHGTRVESKSDISLKKSKTIALVTCIDL